MSMHQYGFDGWMMGWGVGHWIIFAAMAAAVLYPIGMILRKLGHSPFWAILAFVLVVNVVALWVVAFSEAPSEGQETRP